MFQVQANSCIENFDLFNISVSCQPKLGTLRRKTSPHMVKMYFRIVWLFGKKEKRGKQWFNVGSCSWKNQCVVVLSWWYWGKLKMFCLDIVTVLCTLWPCLFYSFFHLFSPVPMLVLCLLNYSLCCHFARFFFRKFSKASIM